MSDAIPVTGTGQSPVEIEFTVAELFNMRDALQRLVQTKLPVKPSSRLRRFAKSVQSELEAAGKEVDEVLADLKDEGGNLKPENGPEANKRVAELMSEIVKIEAIPLSLTDLEKVEISAADLIACEKYILGE